MAVDLAYLSDVAAEFATADSARVDRLVVICSSLCPASYWSDPVQRDLAIAYRVAHMLKVSALKGAGAVTAEAIGDLSRSFAAPTPGTDAELGSTSYGMAFLSLRRAQVRGPLLA